MMKKKILGLALIAMSVVTFSGMAQTTNKDNNVKKENIKGKKADKQVRRNQVNPFEGLNLTDAQKTSPKRHRFGHHQKRHGRHKPARCRV